MIRLSLRRPGRFDRVVYFPNTTLELRQKYFRLMNPGFSSASLKELAAKSGGFSFAQLWETYIMAARLAFEVKGEINMLSGITSFRDSMLFGSKRRMRLASGIYPPAGWPYERGQLARTG